jgi:Family of unknown function (DUF6188)
MTPPSDTSLFGGKELAAVGEPVWAITLDSNVVILMGQHREHEFRIENDIAVENHDDGSSFSVRYDPYNRADPIRENLTELAAIIGRTVVHAKAYVSGILEIALDDGTVLTVAPKDKYEAWTYTFGNFMLSCPPGGFDRLLP